MVPAERIPPLQRARLAAITRQIRAPATEKAAAAGPRSMPQAISGRGPAIWLASGPAAVVGCRCPSVEIDAGILAGRAGGPNGGRRSPSPPGPADPQNNMADGQWEAALRDERRADLDVARGIPPVGTDSGGAERGREREQSRVRYRAALSQCLVSTGCHGNAVRGAAVN